MITLVSEVAVEKKYVIFLEALRAQGFEGEITSDYANRIVLATDNSIYQRLPKAAVYPKHADDLERLARLAGLSERSGVECTAHSQALNASQCALR